MNDSPPEDLGKKPVGNLTDFVTGVDDTNPLDVQIAVDDNGRVVVFHDKPFKGELSWFEYDLGENRLDFVMDNGDVRDIGRSLSPQISKHMQNTHQILTVLMDDKTGDPTKGVYVPLILHQK